MVLYREDGKLAVPDALNCAIVEVDVSHLQVGRARDSVNRTLHGKTVVLRGNLYPVGFDIAHRVIPPVVTERKLYGFRAKCEPD